MSAPTITSEILNYPEVLVRPVIAATTLISQDLEIAIPKLDIACSACLILKVNIARCARRVSTETPLISSADVCVLTRGFFIKVITLSLVLMVYLFYFRMCL